MQWEKFKNLDFLCQTHDDARTCVVLFHGYGADAEDLASLGGVFKLKKQADWFFPQGVHSVPIGPMMSGRAWFNLRVSDFQQTADGKVLDQAIDPEVQKVLSQVTDWLNHLGKLYDQVFIGGFSQGAILTSHCFYRLNFKPAGLLLLSGFMINSSAMPSLPDELKIPFIQTHGLRDEVLPIGGARKLYEKLTGMGLPGQWIEFSGGHEIPMNVISESQTFLNSFLGS